MAHHERAIERIVSEAGQVLEMAKHAQGFQSLQLFSLYAGLARAAFILEEIQKSETRSGATDAGSCD
jgi:hypothetical protein